MMSFEHYDSRVQVRAARVAADAVIAAQSGDMEQTALAVLKAAQEMKVELEKQQQLKYKSVKSKMCSIL